MDSLYEIKSLNNSHCRQIVDLILPIQQNEFNVPVTLESQPDLLDIETHYLRPGGGFWGAFHGDELVGTIALIDTGHHAGAIRKMFVARDYRGRTTGLARRLLETLIAYGAARGMTDLYLGTVAQLQAARRFYERNGFIPIDRDALPPYFPKMQVDTHFYHLNLAPRSDERD
ncbi:GNAT family N-acetyltransferase [Larkinella soli]|uniref:GNAT family N-acetyltransferase n=1 Tax=Larkinella soli TaxID=1770527 RepID=UPI000FFC2959|nr:GNAT family N-acetyltransferase [Larkinella soli]